MGFDDLAQRMGKRHGVSPELLADPAALARKSERNQYRTLFFGGIVLVGLVVALTIGLAATGWAMPTATGALVFAGGVAIIRGAQGLLKLRRTARQVCQLGNVTPWFCIAKSAAEPSWFFGNKRSPPFGSALPPANRTGLELPRRVMRLPNANDRALGR